MEIFKISQVNIKMVKIGQKAVKHFTDVINCELPFLMSKINWKQWLQI